MPDTASPRITLPQVLALLVIWTAAIFGLIKPADRDARALAAKVPPTVSCAKALRAGRPQIG
ncbi:hypothetical protein [Caulobacter segnis]|uniref:Uncharacterized protein n=1 Tax=Caulobacter segnis TaxID=88688 RepID=A0A2W5VET9_9CAUL|nr:hypothetical protein [Caulobacter segnis]PZR35076.1 MAG: hypothetical protein DI526_08370 [Caulobacter segnis]